VSEGHTAVQLVEALFDSRWCHWNFSFIYSFRPHYGPVFAADSHRNKYQKYSWVVKEAGAQGWQLYHLYVFYVSLTVHLSITLANDQLDAQIFNTFITILYMYMFRAISCSSSGGQIVLPQHLVSSLWKRVALNYCNIICCIAYKRKQIIVKFR